MRGAAIAVSCLARQFLRCRREIRQLRGADTFLGQHHGNAIFDPVDHFAVCGDQASVIRPRTPVPATESTCPAVDRLDSGRRARCLLSGRTGVLLTGQHRMSSRRLSIEVSGRYRCSAGKPVQYPFLDGSGHDGNSCSRRGSAW